MTLALMVAPELAPVLDAALRLLFRRLREEGIRPPADALELAEWAQVVTRGLSLAPLDVGADDAPMQLLTIPEVAAELDCGVTKVKKLITDGKLVAVTFGRVRRVRRSDLDEYIAGLAPGGSSFRDRVITKGTA